LFFIGDGKNERFDFLLPFYDFYYRSGMTQAMITAARLIAHKSVNGVYQSLMQMDQMENLGQYVPPFSLHWSA